MNKALKNFLIAILILVSNYFLFRFIVSFTILLPFIINSMNLMNFTSVYLLLCIEGFAIGFLYAFIIQKFMKNLNLIYKSLIGLILVLTYLVIFYATNELLKPIVELTKESDFGISSNVINMFIASLCYMIPFVLIFGFYIWKKKK